jgi:hypothetical protein
MQLGHNPIFPRFKTVEQQRKYYFVRSLLIGSQIRAIKTYPELAKAFDKADLLCSELGMAKAHATAAKVNLNNVVQAYIHYIFNLIRGCCLLFL